LGGLLRALFWVVKPQREAAFAPALWLRSRPAILAIYHVSDHLPLSATQSCNRADLRVLWRHPDHRL